MGDVSRRQKAKGAGCETKATSGLPSWEIEKGEWASSFEVEAAEQHLRCCRASSLRVPPPQEQQR
jgi:hypothetical protein